MTKQCSFLQYCRVASDIGGNIRNHDNQSDVTVQPTALPTLSDYVLF